MSSIFIAVNITAGKVNNSRHNLTAIPQLIKERSHFLCRPINILILRKIKMLACLYQLTY